MARPRARHAARSANPKATRKQKNPYDISFAGAHPLVRKNWDKKLTLKQNYEKMGLLSLLNGAAGGQEGDAALRKQEAEEWERRREDVEWRVIEHNDKETTSGAGTNSAAREDDESSDDSEAEEEYPSDYDVDADGPIVVDIRATRIGLKPGLKRLVAPVAPAPTSIVAAMEAEAASAVKIFRKASEQEQLVYGDLMKKHGDDYDAMSRDRRLNRYQLSAGQLRKKFDRLTW
ncbi:ribosome biogenesis protein Nop16 [Phlyctochytrium arcticum]|nr:ribosome biogenesis protein Nop16 [Phlyctochytrium arcticum]